MSGLHAGVLQGVRIVELASWTYVPSAGAALSDWGADVIKVEGVATGDPGRALVVGGFTRQAARPDADFILELGNRGKRSIAIDIKSDRGRELFGRLLASADVFLTNWLPGALERARLTVEDIRSFNPKIIIARGTGLGVRGPDRDRGGFDAATYLARGGVAYTLTPFGSETPAVQGPGFGDLQGGATLAGGVCAALFHRERTGEPTIVDSSLLAQAMWSIAPSISAADFFDIDGIPGAPPGWPSIRSSTGTRPKTGGGSSWCFCSPTSSGRASASAWDLPNWPTMSDSSRPAT
jgi:crotonobetainyl-CoA:carnitine CoA-transferase CaiB-like acyl-CoA transferase